MSACPLQSVLADFEDACKSLDDKDAIREIMLVADSLRLGGAILGIYAREKFYVAHLTVFLICLTPFDLIIFMAIL